MRLVNLLDARLHTRSSSDLCFHLFIQAEQQSRCCGYVRLRTLVHAF